MGGIDRLMLPQNQAEAVFAFKDFGHFQSEYLLWVDLEIQKFNELNLSGNSLT
jgi:hypothetical protein